MKILGILGFLGIFFEWICGGKWVYSSKNVFRILKSRRKLGKTGEKVGTYSHFLGLFLRFLRFLRTYWHFWCFLSPIFVD